MVSYPQEIAQRMRQFFESLSEKDRRRYAGIEALKYGHGGRNSIAQVLGWSRRTGSKGAKDVGGLSRTETEKRMRRPGGGRRSSQETWLDIDEKFLHVLRDHTAGDPMDETVRWTDLRVKEMGQLLRDDHEITVSKSVVRTVLKQHNSRRRKAQKKQTMKRVKYRNEPCETMQRLKVAYEAAGNPIVSMDTKKKEQWGNFSRDGHWWTLEELKTYDHDCGSFSEGVIIPHSFDDMRRNVGSIPLGTSHDTSACACDSFRHWWYHYGRLHSPNATSILVLCDGGGRHSSRHHIFQQALQVLADAIGVEIRMAHYPPYCSQYNPIEHRLFPPLTRACQGVVFTRCLFHKYTTSRKVGATLVVARGWAGTRPAPTGTGLTKRTSSIDVVKHLLQTTQTSRGLKVFVHILDTLYQTGRKVADDCTRHMTIAHDSFLPQWNYRAIPSVSRNGEVI